jgi:ankyrin repeat protein
MPLKRRWELGSAALLLLCLLAIGGVYGYRRYLDVALRRALDRGECRTAITLVRAGADPRLSGEWGSSALDAAIYEDNPAFLHEVIQRAPKLLPKTEFEAKTPLIQSATEGSNACVRSLLDAGTDVNEVDSGGGTALMGAAAQNRTETLHLLLARGASVNAQDEYGSTALMQAAWGWRVEAVAILMAAGADLKRRDQEGRTALDCARTFHADDHDVPTAAEKDAQRRILALLQRSPRGKARPR